MDWRTSDELRQPDPSTDGHVAARDTGRGALADAAVAALAAHGHGIFRLEPALDRELQVARAAGQRFGVTGPGVSR
jgi:hypothetical protein